MLSLVRLLGVAALLAVPSLASNHDSLRSNKRSHRQAVNAARDVQELAERDIVERSNGTESTLVKRAFTGQGTYFYVGLGACGQWSKDSDYMVALNTAQYGGGYPGPQCFKQITIQANGVTVGGITIMDECPTCGWGSLDLSPGLFQRFADLGAGVIDITWWFDGDSGPAPSSAAPPPPPAPSSSTNEWWTWTQTSTEQWTPTSSSTPAWSPPPTSTSAWTSTSSSTSSSAASSSSSVAPSSSSSSAAPRSSTNNFVIEATQSAVPDVNVQINAQANNLAGLSGLVAAYGQLIVVGAGGQVYGY